MQQASHGAKATRELALYPQQPSTFLGALFSVKVVEDYDAT
jgi:hypothetical protein